MTGHIGVDVSGAASINLNASFLNLREFAEYSCVDIDADFGDSITLLFPTFFNDFVLCDRLLELCQKCDELIFGKIFSHESLLDLLARNVFDFSCHGPDSDDFSLITNMRKNGFRYLHRTIEILNRDETIKITVRKVLATTSELKVSPLVAIPALLSRTWTLLYLSFTTCEKDLMLSELDTSSCSVTILALGKRPLSSSQLFVASYLLRQAMMMFQPCFWARFSTIP